MYSSLLKSLQFGTKTLVELRHYERAHIVFFEGGKKVLRTKEEKRVLPHLQGGY